MKFGVGKDLAAVMIKAILLSMMSVFTLCRVYWYSLAGLYIDPSIRAIYLLSAWEGSP